MKRYTQDPAGTAYGMTEDPEGEWVRVDDPGFAGLLKVVDMLVMREHRLKLERRVEFKAHYNRVCELRNERDTARAEVERLKASGTVVSESMAIRRLEESRTGLAEALRSATEAICAEYCSSDHHGCASYREALYNYAPAVKP